MDDLVRNHRPLIAGITNIAGGAAEQGVVNQSDNQNVGGGRNSGDGHPLLLRGAVPGKPTGIRQHGRGDQGALNAEVREVLGRPEEVVGHAVGDLPDDG